MSLAEAPAVTCTGTWRLATIREDGPFDITVNVCSECHTDYLVIIGCRGFNVTTERGPEGAARIAMEQWLEQNVRNRHRSGFAR